jgi:hypothetical protein
MMGDAIQAPAGVEVRFVLKMKELVGAHPEIIRDGGVAGLIDASPVQQGEETRAFNLRSDGGRHWVRVNVRASDGKLLVLGNPIYMNY